MKNHRPDGWVNPYMGKVGGDLGNVFEAGADAMYEPAYQKGRSDEREELRARGLYGEYCEDFIVSSRVKPDEPDWAEAFFATLENKGTLVFIPEEE